MKHVLTSAGMLALGAVALHATDPQLTRQNTGRPWSLSATVRGFYDDNINTSPEKVVIPNANPALPSTVVKRQSSYGVQFAPSVSLNLPLEQTFISLGFTYGLMWYENREPKQVDQNFLFTGQLTHQFNPRNTITVKDAFVYSDEPTVVEQNGIITAPTKTRTDSSVFHNIGGIDYTFQLAPKVGLNFAYDNNWYDYEQKGAGSRSALLDRIEQLIHGDVRYGFTPTFIGLLGYAYGMYNYTGDQLIDAGSSLKSDDRNNTSQYGYLGTDYDITAKLRTSVRLGAQYTDYDSFNDSKVNPFALATLTYVYMQQSSVQVGIRHNRNATDVVAIDTSGTPTLDQITTAVFGKITQQITPNLNGSVIGQYQYSTFNQGFYGDQAETLWLAGVNLEYVFNRHWSADVGYNYDTLNSDIPNRDYNRNRVYLGVRLTY